MQRPIPARLRSAIPISSCCAPISACRCSARRSCGPAWRPPRRRQRPGRSDRMLDIFLALGAGILTVAAPCVLPMLPIILGVSVGQRDPARPLLITLGFAATFALMAFLFGLFPTVLGLSQETLRDAASIT